MPFLSPNQRLKELRSRLGITTREVAVLSQRIADEEGNLEFHISNPWLTQVENSHSIPGIHKLYSLSAIYRIQITELFLLFRIDLTKLPKYRFLPPPNRTQLMSLDAVDMDETVQFPSRWKASFDLRHTNLLSSMVAAWGKLPIKLIQGLDIRHNLYGYIGLEDHTLSPMLRPGSFVQIDRNARKILAGPWRTEYDRPIYFVELSDGYSCAWCELQDKNLILLPHPLSPAKVRRVAYGTDAKIIGRVTGAEIRLTGNPPINATPPKKMSVHP